MAAHGGVYHIYQISGATTHIIASNLSNVKIKQLGSVPIVKAAWITDSIAYETLLDYSKYKRTNQAKTSKQGRGAKTNKIPVNNLMKYFQPRLQPSPTKRVLKK